MRTWPRIDATVLALLAACGIAGCASSDGGGTNSAGSGGSGVPGSGGRTSSGGGTGTGSGGTIGSSGGAPASSGGTPGSGGSASSGGVVGAGGVIGSGGSAGGGGGGGGGGTSGSGMSAGGKVGTGGVTSSGGAAAGRAGNGGASGGGGHPGAGGAAGTPGSGGSAGASACADLGGGPTDASTTHLDIGVHDPSMIWDGTSYYLFATGGTLGVRSSSNLRTWSNAGQIFASVPAWIRTALGSSPTDLWAPDISYFNCQFHVYYAGSTFGSNASVIGLATNGTLSSKATGYKWVDQGLIVQSKTSDNFNAIDPNVSFDATGAPWLAFGSFWTGIKMRKLDPVTGKLSTTDTTTYSLAGRGSGGAIEAASIVSHNGYYYLFVSFDACCKGVDSTYRTMVGRGSAITGPYTDKAGKNMTTGAAEQLLATSGRYIGPGGGTAFRDGATYLYAYHYYDGDDNGASKLQVRPITWDSGDWPVLGTPLFP
jgi:arabinan endo-1,5-alpha-L-arabinosidase